MTAPALGAHKQKGDSLTEGVSNSTANVDVDTKPVARVALSARKANDWQLVNFPDVADLKSLREFWEQAKTYEDLVNPPAAPELAADNLPPSQAPPLADEMPQDTSPLISENGALDAAKPQLTKTTSKSGHRSMKLLRSLVKSKDTTASDAEVVLTLAAQKWADTVCQLFNAVSDMMMLLERSGVSPFIVFVNPKSGGQLGSLILKESYAYLNPWQVVDMSIEKNPLEALSRFQGLAVTGRLRALACGGDGTVSWVVDSVHTKCAQIPNYETLTKLYQCAKTYQSIDAATTPKGPGTPSFTNLVQALREVSWEPAQIPVAVLPLGTGNDLSKVLNWGATFTNYLDYLPFMRKLIFAKPVQIDMWTLEIYKMPKPTTANATLVNSGSNMTSSSTRRNSEADAASTRKQETGWASQTVPPKEPTSPPISSKTFTNYVDLGIAARIALKFHTLREAHPELFRSRLGNKFLYGEVGVRDYLVDQSINLKDIAIWCENEKIDLDRVIEQGGLEGLAVVNIPSFGGGVEPWKGVSGNFRKGRHSRFKGNRSITNLLAAAADHSGGHAQGEDSEGNMSSGGPLADSSTPKESRSSSNKPYPHSNDVGPTLHHSASMIIYTDDEQHDPKEQYLQFRPQRMADGRLELVGFRSLLHLGKVQVGMADSVKIAQGKNFTIQVKHKVPYQVDGEPSTIALSEMRIRWKCRTTVLALKEGPLSYERRLPVDDIESPRDLHAINLNLDDIKKALEKANDAGEINDEQLCQLLRRFRYLGHPQLASF